MGSANTKMQLGTTYILLIAFAGSHAIQSECPCKNEGGEITCDPNTVVNFPDDLNQAACDLKVDTAWGLNIMSQDITILKNNAFVDFKSLHSVALAFNQITRIEKNAFIGLKEVTYLSLQNNNITTIEDGALDHLVSINQLDLRSNDFLTSYTSLAWTFCENVNQNYQYFQLENMNIEKRFEANDMTEDFCDQDRIGPLDACFLDNGVMDCTKANNLGSQACSLLHQVFDHITFLYPADIIPQPTADFYEGQSNRFFREFNLQTNGSLDHFQYMNEFTLYETKFDLSELAKYTVERTKKVTIKADTVHMTAPITISHKLEIEARIVSLTYPITMNMTREDFVNDIGLKSWAFKEEVYVIDAHENHLMLNMTQDNYVYDKYVSLNKKSYGLISILRSGDEESNPNDMCQPSKIDVIESNSDISKWYDPTTINLIYVCARTVYDSGKSPELVKDITDFQLKFMLKDSLVNNQKAFSANTKYQKLSELNKVDMDVHNVPAYSLGTVKELAHIMSEKMALYKANERAQENLMSLASSYAQDAQVQFDIVEASQKLYFEKEQLQLDLIWQQAEIDWNTGFAHRNEIEGQISDSLDTINDQLYDMKTQALDLALNEAQSSKDHMENVVSQYQSQVNRISDKVTKSINYQKELKEKMKKASVDMQDLFDTFEKEVNEWKEEQKAKAAWGFFKAFVTFGISIAAAIVDPAAIGACISAAFDIIDLIMDLFAMMETFNELQDMIDELLDSFNDIADIGPKLNSNFKDALGRSVELKLKAPSFDVLDRTAEIKIADLNEVTNNEIACIPDVMLAMTAVSNIGHQLISEAADFAETCLELAERGDALAVAKADLERTTQEIDDILNKRQALEDERKIFENDRNKAKEEYERWLKDLQDQYNDITEEALAEFKEKITDSFKAFQQTFTRIADAYKDQLFSVTEGIHQKFYQLKEHSMTQRAMVISIYQDFCDALYYATFKSCTADEYKMPSMSDEFEEILEFLSDIQWDAIQAGQYLGNQPQPFTRTVTINDNEEWLSNGKPNKYLENLRLTGEAAFNIADVDQYLTNRYWRVRIDSIWISLHYEDGSAFLSPSYDSTWDPTFQVDIYFPTMFNDKDSNKMKHAFLAQKRACMADYSSNENGLNAKSKCEVDHEWTENVFKPSADGQFRMKVI